jgi:simple sugar transport system permease protein
MTTLAASGRRSRIIDITNPILAVLIAFVLSGFLVVLAGGDPLEAYGAIAKGAFGSASALNNTVRYTLPILLLAISFALSYRAGYFNIGQEGQMYASALTVAGVQVTLGGVLPTWLLLIVMILAGMIAGGIVSLVPAYLKQLFGINEVVIGILLNYLLISLSGYMLLYTALGKPESTVAMSVDLTPQPPGILVAILGVVIVVAYALFLRRTVGGYRLRIVGENPTFGLASGMSTLKVILVAAFVAGAIASLTSTGELTAVYHKYYVSYADGLSFAGLTAAFIGRLKPAGMVLGALLLGALQSGSVGLSIDTDVPPEIVVLVRGFVMLFGTVAILQFFIRHRRAKRGTALDTASKATESTTSKGAV